MLNRIRERFGTAGLVVSIMALVLALAGGAFAAAGGLTAKQKTQVKAIAKQFAGKPGATGPAGPAGANGKDGANGTSGTNGTDGDDGTSIANSVESPGGNCARGGSKFVGTATTYACNGADGSPWTAGGTLPAGATQTGVFAGLNGVNGYGYLPVSFNVPLSPTHPALTNTANIKVIDVGGAIPNECETAHTGTASAANPEADPGYVCFFITIADDVADTFAGTYSPGGSPGFVGVSGAILPLSGNNGEGVFGAYAVTG
jgi:hypothetical protein